MKLTVKVTVSYCSEQHASRERWEISGLYKKDEEFTSDAGLLN